MNKEEILNHLCDASHLLDNAKDIFEILTKELKTEQPVVKIEPLTRTERGAYYEKEYGLGNLGTKIDNKLILVSLICSFTLMARAQNPSMTVMEVIKKLTNYETIAMDDKYGEEGKFYENLAITCESFMYGVTEGNTFGLKTGKEVRDKVIEIISNRLPF